MILALTSQYKTLSLLALALKQSNKKSCEVPTGRKESPVLGNKDLAACLEGFTEELRLSFCFSLMSLEH